MKLNRGQKNKSSDNEKHRKTKNMWKICAHIKWKQEIN